MRSASGSGDRPSAPHAGVDYDGGWAEYALASHHTLTAISASLPFEQAAIIPAAVSTRC